MPAQVVSVLQSGDRSSDMSITWNMQPNTTGLYVADYVGAPTYPTFVPTPAGNVYEFILDPSVAQQSTNFGVARTVGLSINRPMAAFTSRTAFFFPGRVFVIVEATGQLFTFSFEQITSGTIGNIWQSKNAMFPVWMKAASRLQVWFEQDNNAGILQPPASQVYLTLYNYAIPGCGYLG